MSKSMKYYVVKCNVETNGLNEVNYGVMLVNDDNSRVYTCNISDNVSEVELLVKRMNDCGVEPQQAKEILEDFQYKKQSVLHT